MGHEAGTGNDLRSLLLIVVTIFTVPTFLLWGVVAYVLLSPSRDALLPLIMPLAVPYAMVVALWVAYGVVVFAGRAKRTAAETPPS